MKPHTVAASTHFRCTLHSALCTHYQSCAARAAGAHLLSGGSDEKIRMWDLTRGGCNLSSHYGHTNSVTSLHTTPDGKYIVSGSHDKTIRITPSPSELVNAIARVAVASTSAAFAPPPT